MKDQNFSELLSIAVKTFSNLAEDKKASHLMIKGVATLCVNDILFSKSLEKLEASCSAFKKFPEQFSHFKATIALFCGGFTVSEDGLRFLDVRNTDEQVKIVSIDKEGNCKFAISPKGKTGKLLMDEAKESWDVIKDKAEVVVFEREKPEKLMSYSDLLKALKRLSKSKRLPCDSLAIAAVFKKLEAELA